eukprot:CAMPEP_0116012746 /NCGR_PEP_ID=MMETSP0321-20121206/5302_1 /TAXON_ID=163516 /ORGANISM="Leptocylindrus danicus var. danicus, Strain B650" /LENGTH=234 /DNA_ID=CAMNT_0003482139 /DNA_START=343 /DNA_END=1044 /DNA_ORIENTATION=-
MSADNENNINNDNNEHGPPPDLPAVPPITLLLYGTTILSALALIFSIASTISCTFTKRNFSARVVGNVHANDLDLFLGIWTWRGLALTNDADTCFRYDELIGSGNDDNDDVMMTVARMVSVLAGLCSGSSMCLAVLFHVSSAHQNDNVALCHRQCRRCTYNDVLTLSVLFFLASVLEGLKLLMIYQADICSDDRFEGAGGSVATYDSCRASSGAYICVLSAALSFLAGSMILLW